jgi:hypothetical protein
VADVAILVIHHLPDDPPTGEPTRMIHAWLPTGEGPILYLASSVAYMSQHMPGYLSHWYEFPTLPADPSERLTTDDLRVLVNASDLFAKENPSPYPPDRIEVATARLRAALPGEEGTK